MALEVTSRLIAEVIVRDHLELERSAWLVLGRLEKLVQEVVPVRVQAAMALGLDLQGRLHMKNLNQMHMLGRQRAQRHLVLEALVLTDSRGHLGMGILLTETAKRMNRWMILEQLIQSGRNGLVDGL
jgi:hypothetical protein